MAQEQLKPTADNQPWTVQRVLDWTMRYLQQHGSESPRLEAELLLAHARNCPRVQLYTQYAAELTAGQRTAMRDLVKRRAAHEPVAYLIGRREFFSLPFRVSPHVLIPRPETETLVLELIEAARELSAPRVLDVGTGSGCIAVAAAVNLPAAHITAVDQSEAAIVVAQQNAEMNDTADRITFLHSDLFEALADDLRITENTRFDVIVSNPPYVAEDEFETLPEQIRRHEPSAALLAGEDGLDVIRRLIAQAPQHLQPGGLLMFEIAPEQSQAVGELLKSAGCYTDIRIATDLSRTPRTAIARLRGDA